MTQKNSHTSWKTRLYWGLVLSIIGVGLVFSIISKRASVVEKVVVRIQKIDRNKSLITKKEVLHIFSDYLGYDVIDSKISELPFDVFEDLLESDKRVRSAEIYLGKNNQLQIYLEPRQPIVRVSSSNGHSYYLDQDGMKIDLKQKNAIRVLMATGNIEGNIGDIINKKETSTLYQVFDIAKKISEDPDFLTPLISQIDVSKEEGIVLVPKLGRQKIHFGKYEDVESKLNKLSIFYQNGLPKAGWSMYEKLRLDWKDRVYAQKKM